MYRLGTYAVLEDFEVHTRFGTYAVWLGYIRDLGGTYAVWEGYIRDLGGTYAVWEGTYGIEK